MIIKWEVGDLNGTSAAIDGGRQPVHPATAGDQHVGIVSHIELAINAAEIEDKEQEQLMPDFIDNDEGKMQEFTLFVTALLVFKDNVRKPNSIAWDTNNRNPIILRFVPGETIISPLL